MGSERDLLGDRDDGRRLAAEVAGTPQVVELRLEAQHVRREAADEPPLHVIAVLGVLGHGDGVRRRAVRAAAVAVLRHADRVVAGALAVPGAERTLLGSAVAVTTVVARLAVLDDVVAADGVPRHVDGGGDPAAVRAAAIAVDLVAVVAHLVAGGGAVAADDGRILRRRRLDADGGDHEPEDDGRERELAELAHENLRLRMRPPPEWRQTLGNVGCRTTWFDSLHLQYDRR